jgi:hypothetical protein
LFRAESSQSRRVPQCEQWSDVENPREGLDDATGDFEEERQQRDGAVDRLHQLIEEHGARDLTRHLDQIDGEAQLKQALVREDIGRRRPGVVEVDESFADEGLGEDSRHDGEQKKQTSHAGQETWRRRGDGCGHLSSSNLRMSPG